MPGTTLGSDNRRAKTAGKKKQAQWTAGWKVLSAGKKNKAGNEGGTAGSREWRGGEEGGGVEGRQLELNLNRGVREL